MPHFLPESPVAFVSPHLDDVALSCANSMARLPGSFVLTPFTEAPPITDPEGSNERKTGEPFAPEALRVRRDEDRAAMEVLNANPRWLGLQESEYVGPGQDVPTIAAVLRSEIDLIGARSVVAPLGVHHLDHLAVSEACLWLMSDMAVDWYLYLDMPYSQAYEDEATARLAALTARFDLVAMDPVDPVGGTKRAAIERYPSQLRDLQRQPAFERALGDPERYWHLHRPERRPTPG